MQVYLSVAVIFSCIELVILFARFKIEECQKLRPSTRVFVDVFIIFYGKLEVY